MDKKALLQMLVCSVLWSIAGIFIKLINCNPMVIAGMRSLFAAITIYIFLRISKTNIFINKKIFISALFMCMSFICFVMANKMTTSANAIVLQYTQPIFIVIISVLFLKKKFIKADIIAITVTLLGMVLFFLDELEYGQIAGNIIAVAAGVFLAVLFAVMGEVTDNERMNTIFFGHIFTAVVGMPFITFTENTITTMSIIMLLILGVVQIGIPYILFAKAVGRCSALSCSLIGIIEPILNPLWVAVFYNEMPGTMSFIGGIIVVLTITIWCIYKNQNTVEV